MRSRFPFAETRAALKQGGFSAVLCDIGNASPDLMHQFYGLMAPRACCLDSNREKDVRGLRLLILCSLVVCYLLNDAWLCAVCTLASTSALSSSTPGRSQNGCLAGKTPGIL